MKRLMVHPLKNSKQSVAIHHIALPEKQKGSNQTAKILEEDSKPKYNDNNKPTLPRNGPVHNMYYWKVMQIQEKSMKATW